VGYLTTRAGMQTRCARGRCRMADEIDLDLP
jgi:hypothetical protein